MTHLITTIEHGQDGDYTLKEWYLDTETQTISCKNKSRNSFSTANDWTWISNFSLKSGVEILEKQLKHVPERLRDIKLKLLLNDNNI